MKKMFALALVLVMLCAAFGALAEGMEPMYATVGDALAAAGENPIAGGEEGYYSVVTEVDGKYYRSVAETDDKYNELQQAVWQAKPEAIDAAFAAADEYVKTLPIAYSEVFTAVPMDQTEMEALVGKTIGELREAGYEDRESGTEGDEIVFVMRNGLFDYACAVEADFDAYNKAMEDGTDGDFTILSVKLRGITSEAAFTRYHTDGTIEEMPDPFEGYAELAADVLEMIGQVQNGEELDVEAFFGVMKDKYPDLADTVDMYLELYRALGAEGLSSLLTPAD